MNKNSGAQDVSKKSGAQKRRISERETEINRLEKLLQKEIKEQVLRKRKISRCKFAKAF